MKSILSLVVALAAIVTVSAAPNTASNGSSAGASSGPKRALALSSQASSSPVITRVAWFKGPQTNNAVEFSAFANKVRNYMFTGQSKPESSADILTPEVLTAPNVLWTAIHVKALNGGKTSLAALVTEMSSPQDSGLFERQTFEGAAYGPNAPGVRNGEYLESGPSTVEVDEFLILVPSRSYTATLAVVTDWIEVQNNNRFAIESLITVGSNPPVASMITTTGYNVAAPTIAIEKTVQDQATLTVTGETGRSYVLYSMTVLGGSRTYIQNFTGSAAFLISTGENKFYGVEAL